MKINGKKILITGGAKRIGRELCRAFADAGAKLIIHYNESGADAAELLAELGGESAGHVTAQADFTCPEKLADWFGKLGKIDVLINSAAIFEDKPLTEESPEDAQRQFNINFWSPLELMKAFQAQTGLDEGCIVNFLDQRIVKVNSGGSYPLSKQSLAEATKSAALQFAPRIRVNGIAPGPVLPPAGMEDSRMQETLKSVPMKKAVAMSDLVESCLFLVRNDSVTGDILFVDCGQSLTGG